MGGTESKIVDSSDKKYTKPKLVSLDPVLKKIGTIEIMGVTLTPDQLHAIVQTVIASGKISDHLKKKLTTAKRNDFVGEILQEKHTNPQEILAHVIDLLTELVRSGDLSKFDEICLLMRGMLIDISPIFGDWMAILLNEVPLSDVIGELVELGAHESFSVAEGLWYEIPDELQNIALNKDKTSKFLREIMMRLKKEVSEMGALDQIESEEFGVQALEGIWGYIGQILISKVIEEQFRPAITPAAQLFTQVVPVVFTILAINQYCTKKGTLLDLGPISVTVDDEMTIDLPSEETYIDDSV